MRKMKKVISLTLVAAMVFSMTACGKKSDGDSASSSTPAGSSAPASSEAPSSKPVTLKTVTQMGGTDANAPIYKEILEQFQKDNPNITVSDDSTKPDQDWKTKIAADFSVGNEPDVIQYYTDGNATDIYKTDKFVSIAEIQKEFPDYAKNISEDAFAATKSTVDGKNYAVPTVGYFEGLYCNKTLFDKYKAPYPTSWDNLVTAIKTFKKNNVTPIAVSLVKVPHYWIEHLMLSMAGAEDYTKVPKDASEVPAWGKGLDLLKELKDMGAFPKDTDTIDEPIATEMFKKGKAAMQLDGSWFGTGLTDAQETTAVYTFPTAPGGKKTPETGITGFSSGFFITKKCWEDKDKRAAAVKYVMANTSDEAIGRYWNGNGTPASKTAPAPEKQGALMKMSIELVNSFTTRVSPTDARLSGEPYSALVDSAVDVSNGAISGNDAIKNMLSAVK